MTGQGITIALTVLAMLMIAEKAWKHAMIVRFFAQAEGLPAASPAAGSTLPLVSIIQPILSGDPTLPACLEHNLRTQSAYDREFIWLVDTTDTEGKRICCDLKARYPEAQIDLVLTPPPPDRHSPKTMKLIEGAARAKGEIICVLDDDTMLPEGGLELCLPHLDRPGVGLAFGLPYYVNFSNFWSALVACFVNSHSLPMYVPVTYLTEPFTINGMFFAVKRSVLDAVGGFRGLETHLMDDFAIAQRFRSAGYRLAQTPLRHGISTRVESSRHYFRLLNRWFIFPRETVMKALPLRDLLIAHGLGLGGALAPLLMLIVLLARPSWAWGAFVFAYLLLSFAMFLHINFAYLPRPTPARACALAPLIQLMLPFQLLAALVSPQRIVWRGHEMQIEPGGRFRFVRRRAEKPE